MKYVISWRTRAGLGADNEAAARRALDVFSKWSPAAGVTFHQFVTRLDGEGGFSVVETDDPRLVLGDTTKFSPWFEFQVYPVMDIQEGVPVLNEALEFRGSIS
ncbi:MAG TPA: DUF3303 family protein [Acidimicrobiales bacterium]|nr:DUF3303 family protein [Acidimicrobiales bacterium]